MYEQVEGLGEGVVELMTVVRQLEEAVEVLYVLVALYLGSLLYRCFGCRVELLRRRVTLAAYLAHEHVALLLRYLLECETERVLVAVAEELRVADGSYKALVAALVCRQNLGYRGNFGIERTEPVRHLAEEGEVLELRECAHIYVGTLNLPFGHLFYLALYLILLYPFLPFGVLILALLNLLEDVDAELLLAELRILHHCRYNLLAHPAVYLLRLAATEKLYLYGLYAAHDNGVLFYGFNGIAQLLIVLYALAVAVENKYETYDCACR